MDELDDAGEHLRVGVRRDAVAEVHNVRGCCGAAADDIPHVRLNDVPRRTEHGRVDIALDWGGTADALDALVEREAVVDALHIGARGKHRRKQLGRADTEVDGADALTTGSVNGARVLQCAGARGGHRLLVAFTAQGSCPRVEELDDARTSADLRLEERCGEVADGIRELEPRLRVAHHRGARAQVILRGAALDDVRGDREGCAGEADERRVAELSNREADGFFDRREEFGVVEAGADAGGKSAGFVGGVGGVLEDRALAGNDVDGLTDELERNHDVAEEDSAVDLVAAHRLERDFGGELGAQAGVEHRDALAHLAVFGKRAAGLAHEPDGERLGAFPAGGADERGAFGASVNEGMLVGERDRVGRNHLSHSPIVIHSR